MSAIFNKLVQRNGNYSLPYLIHLYDNEDEDKREFEMFFVNANEDITFESQTYTAGTFSYASNASENGFDGGGKLEIAIKDTQIVNMIESVSSLYLDVTGVMNTSGTIQKIKSFKHHYGKVTGDKTKVSISFEKDDRQAMTFPSLIWSALNNRGNS